MPIVLELMTIRPIFSSGVILDTRSAARSAGLSGQSLYGSSTPLPLRSLNRNPCASRTGFTLATTSTWSPVPALRARIGRTSPAVMAGLVATDG
ncbi:MAG TPA: hypothetical protein VJ820_00660, partial [Propionibacteriaceae bacterium]|nr:hypothetical protein [Propionibacteriaceae bacterium]